MVRAKKVKTTGISEEFIFENYPELLVGKINDHLTANEQAGFVTLPAAAVFQDLLDPGQYEDNDETWSMTFRTPKGTPAAQKLFAVVDLIAHNTWGDEATERLEEIFGAIGQGVKPKHSPISIQDGDQIRPQFNGGCWVIKASRKAIFDDPEKPNGDRPHIYGADGTPVLFDDDVESDDENFVVSGDIESVPARGDECVVVINVWAMGRFDRINTSIEAVRMVKKWSGGGAKRLDEDDAKRMIEDMAAHMPALPAGAPAEEDDEVAPNVSKKRAPKKKAAAKSGAKKATGTKRSSVFRK